MVRSEVQTESDGVNSRLVQSTNDVKYSCRKVQYESKSTGLPLAADALAIDLRPSAVAGFCLSDDLAAAIYDDLAPLRNGSIDVGP